LRFSENIFLIWAFEELSTSWSTTIQKQKEIILKRKSWRFHGVLRTKKIIIACGPVAVLRTRLTQDITVGDLVLVKVENATELERVKQSVANVIMQIQWFGNQFDDGKKKLWMECTSETPKAEGWKQPPYTVANLQRKRRKRPQRLKTPDINSRRQSNGEDSTIPDSILMGPVKLNQSNGKEHQKLFNTPHPSTPRIYRSGMASLFKEICPTKNTGDALKTSSLNIPSGLLKICRHFYGERWYGSIWARFGEIMEAPN
jgi:hypothetical protein